MTKDELIAIKEAIASLRNAIIELRSVGSPVDAAIDDIEIVIEHLEEIL